MTRSALCAGRVELVALGAAALVAALVLVALGVFRAEPPDSAPRVGVTAAPPAQRVAPSLRSADAHDDLPHTELPLRLVATVLREARRLSLATVEDTRVGGHQVMNEGQAFRNHPEARLASIERGRVLIDNDGVREQLVIDRSARPANLNAPSPEQVESRRDLSRRLRTLTDAGTNYRDVVGRGRRGGLLAEGEVSPVYEEGELIGIQLDDLREGGVYEQVGLRNGDVVTAVNGVSLGEPTAAAEVLAELALSDLIEVAVERADGTQELLSVPTAEFTAAVDNLE